MKRAPLFLMFFLLFGLAEIPAQENSVSAAKWTRIESANKEFSAALPPNGVIDAEERKFGQKLRVVAFQNGVEMELKIFEGQGAKERLMNMPTVIRDRTVIFKVGDFSVLKSELGSASKFQNAFWIAKKETLYYLGVTAKTGQEKEVARFFYSIRLDGKSFVVQKEKQNFAEEIVPAAALKTSPEVIEAFNRRPQKNNINVTYEAVASNAEDIETAAGLTRPVVILERPIPAVRPGLGGSAGGSGVFSIRLKVNFLANGQIGDIVVLSAVNKEFSKAFVEATQKIRFVPAQVNGKNADAARIIDYAAQIFSMPAVR